jgi:hypothetical protein
MLQMSIYQYVSFGRQFYSPGQDGQRFLYEGKSENKVPYFIATK